MGSNVSSIHLTGNVTSAPYIVKKDTTGTLVALRVAVNHRYRTPEGEWRDGEAMFLDVQCWGQLGLNVLSSIIKGTPILVIGRLIQSTWKVEDAKTGECQNRSVLKIKASHVGVDLNTRRVDAFRATAGREESERDAATGAQVGTEHNGAGGPARSTDMSGAGATGSPQMPAEAEDNGAGENLWDEVDRGEGERELSSI
ncbi:single-stranded DNA-binding protein [Corynebacterium heidelbergense]|uniref:Single-stranded DNA-binding protein n=1 Tax=Corynebacterium heidelbergense TaxID=2055947 RepID=A0A364VDD9_9CORY|nr:single-stranded DNA-binding protein [Corynebacterium heidelbergense]RAV34628.1 hypothetical protein CWC39_02175 [Corynebacterium heidelbergense]WCZ36192.1 Single-stranded DNA-binding protein [Corynebacterium heidelbergense]